MLHWYPKIKHLNIPQPETKIVEIPFYKFTELIDGNSTLSEYSETFSKIIQSLEPFPIFLRTDNSSQKHSFKKTCRLPDEKSLFGHIIELVDSNLACDLTDNALVFRKWLDLDAGFSAFDGLPIGIEARVFINAGVTQCIHPYWPEDAIQQWLDQRESFEKQFDTKLSNTINPRWGEILKSQNDIVIKSRFILEKYCTMVIDSMDNDYWSVDFALGRDGRWYLIDMAAGELSYHPDCKF
jgi:hypothetical protein